MFHWSRRDNPWGGVPVIAGEPCRRRMLRRSLQVPGSVNRTCADSARPKRSRAASRCFCSALVRFEQW